MSDAPAVTEARKVVTVLFTDITGSTGLGERLDPEPLRHVLSRYFDEMQVVVERHGGIVTKFIGDAVMAVFGIPTVHEDDALRAVRATAEMRSRLAELNDEFAASWGVTVAVRTGVNTGEVLAGEPSAIEALVVGDAVNTAARLEQTATPGEILMGDETYRLVHEAVTAERVGPLDLRGKRTPVPAWRLIDVVPTAPGWGRRLDSQLVGRTRELALLEEAFERSATGSACEVVTVMGPAGVGKSRLTLELVTRLGSRAAVVQGPCLSYGDGITFWPVTSVVMEAIGMEERETQAEAKHRLSDLLVNLDNGGADDDAAVRDGLEPLLGLRPAEVGIQQTYWAVRRFIERLASRGPLVVVFDDIHWGESTFLDLLEYLADGIRGAPVLILCQARGELLDVRPQWMSAKPNASSVVLKPLTEDETDGLIRGLVGGIDVPVEARARIAEMAEGNPLYVEETIRMLVDDGVLQQVAGRWTLADDPSKVAVPPTIHALLAARLDRLEPDQRTVIERGSVVGRSFWWGAVSDLSPEAVRPRVGTCLQSLVRKELIRPDSSEIRGEDAFRFTHILVRDAAYNGIPKSTRVELHERLADWIEAHTKDVAGEYEEIVAYHLEQAHRALLELGPPSDRTAALGERAAERLASAGERAFARGDMPAAVNFLSRATALLPDRHSRRLELLPEVAFALLESGNFEGLMATAGEMEAAAAETGDERLQAHATVIGLWIRVFTNPEGWLPEAEREATLAIDTFGRLGDERGLARAWSVIGLVGILTARFVPAENGWSRAVEHARRAGNHRDALEGLSWVAATVWLGPTPAEEGIRRCREVFDEAQGDRKAMSTALFAQGGLEAGLGHFDEARDLFGRSRALMEEVALLVWAAGALSQAVAWALLLEGKPAAAEEELWKGYETLRAIGEVSFLSTVAGILAEAIFAQGRYDEAEEFTRISEESAGAEDAYSQVLWRSVRAKCAARQGNGAEALRLVREAVTLVETTDSLDLQWLALMSKAEVLRLAGRPAEAENALNAAIDVAERKQNLVAARRAREALRGLVEPPAAPVT